MTLARNTGFSLIELIAVLVLVGILATSASVKLSSNTFQLQASRDRVATAFFAAQQRAMVQRDPVRLTINASSQVDIRQDTDQDGDFTDESSLRLGGTSYPISLLPSQQLTSAVFDFNRLGKTSPTTLVLSQSSSSVTISVSANGFVL